MYDKLHLMKNTLILILLFATCIIQAQSLSLAFSWTNVTCNGFCDGVAAALASGGQPPYTYAWPDGLGTQPTATGICAGSYEVTLTDAENTTTTSILTVTQPTLLEVVGTVIPAVCGNDVNSGSMIVTVAGGVPPYAYLWSNGVTTPVVTGLGPGNYQITVVDANGCIGEWGGTVAPPSTPAIQFNATVVPTGCGIYYANINPSGGVPPYTYLWSNGSTVQNQVGLTPGTYQLQITDGLGCVADTVFVLLPQAPYMTSYIDNCDGSLEIGIAGGVPPYTYEWSGPPPNNVVSTSQVLSGVPPGVYILKVTDALGCMGTFTGVIHPLLGVSLYSCNNTLIAIPTGGAGVSYTYTWSPLTGISCDNCPNPTFDVQTPTTYTVSVTDQFGCVATESITVGTGIDQCPGYIGGKVYKDEEPDCTYNNDDFGLENWIVKAEKPGATFFGTSDANGNYLILVDTGDYVVSVTPPSSNWDLCQNNVPVTAVLADTQAVDFPTYNLYNCPALTVDIGTDLLRRCMVNKYTVSYCNNGPVDATDATVVITLDPLFSYFASEIPLASQNGNELTFNLGTLAPGQCGHFWVRVTLSCSAVLGQTHCIEAHILPDTICDPISPLWDGSDIEVNAICHNDSVFFNIKNTGIGDMTELRQYFVVEDQILLMMAPFQLNAGQETSFALEPQGATLHMEAEQSPFHPGASQPSVTVEGCGGGGGQVTLGLVNQFPPDDMDPFIDIDCRQNVGSYDPNDKQGFPEGYGDMHYIKPNTDLEYLIRFQNTGTDTAFRVVVLDTLSNFLDITSIHPGASSHPYDFDIVGRGVLKFTFDNILLPDSTTNEEESHGFVKFRISQLQDLPLGSEITNTAAIYFDFNEPVITNQTIHRVNEGFITVVSTNPISENVHLKVYPNPFSDWTRFELEGIAEANASLIVYDAYGRTVMQRVFDQNQLLLNASELAAGMYFYQVRLDGKVVNAGKMVKQ